MKEPDRALMRYYGGKWRIANWILGFFPPHTTYVEPYGGAASILLKKQRARKEVYNDIDREMFNLFKVLREQPQEIIRLAALTPVSRDEYEISKVASPDPLEQARRTLYRGSQAFSSSATPAGNMASGWRPSASDSMAAREWTGLPPSLAHVVARMRGVLLENMDALEVMAKYDTPQTLFYVDPPYVLATRDANTTDAYSAEMSDAEHEKLAVALHGLQGMVIVSGYESALYNRLFADWQKHTKETTSDANTPRVECLWVKPYTGYTYKTATRKQRSTH